jgi:hypothetical protein
MAMDWLCLAFLWHLSAVGRKARKKVRRADRVAFIAMMDTIKTELEQGHTARSIYVLNRNNFEAGLTHSDSLRLSLHRRMQWCMETPFD